MKTKEIVIPKILTKEMVLFFSFLLSAYFAPLLSNQIITGSLVNAVLFLSVLFIGIRPAVLIAVLPSSVAILTGLLPQVMIPMVPFIITGNIILIMVFYKMKENFFSGVIFASFLKFSFLFFSSQIVINLFIEGEVAKKLLFMMSYPQFLTALFGGALAFLLSFLIKKGKIENNYNSVL